MKTKFFKRLLVLFLSLLLVHILTACSQNNIIPEKTSETTKPSNEDSSTLNILLIPPVTTEKYNSLENALSRINDALSDLVYNDLGIRVSITLMTENNYSKDPVSVVTSGKYDLLADQYSYLQDFAKKGQVLDLKPYLKDSGAAILNTYEFPELVTAFEINGGLYGLPSHQPAATGPAVLFNKEVLKRSGYDASEIRSFADIDMLYEKVAASEPDMYMAWIRPFDAYKYPPLSYVSLINHDSFLALTGDVEKDTTVHCLLETDDYLEWTQYLYQWNDRGWLHPDTAGNSPFTYNQAISSTLDLKRIRSLSPLYELVHNKEVFSFYLAEYNPYALSYYEEYCSTELAAVPLGNAVFTTSSLEERYFWMVPASSGHPEDAVRLLEYMNTSKDCMNLLNWGQENKDYVIGNDNLFDYPSDDRTELWHLGKGDYLPNQYMLTPWTGQDPFVYDDMLTFGRSALRSGLLSFWFDSSPVDQELSNCGNILMSYMSATADNFLDPYDLPQMIEEMKAADLDKVLDECQRQADAFLKGE